MAKPLSENRRARFDYEIIDRLEAGIELLGSETKSARSGRMGLSGSYAVIRDGQLWLLNAQVPPYQQNNTPENYEPARTRRLLLRKSEISRLSGILEQKGTVLVALKAYTKRNRIKIELGVGRSRKTHDKRELLKKKADIREMRKAR
jgi:SsrA-binding protein